MEGVGEGVRVVEVEVEQQQQHQYRGKRHRAHDKELGREGVAEHAHAAWIMLQNALRAGHGQQGRCCRG